MELCSEMSDARREQLLLDHVPQVQFIARRIHSRLPQSVPIEDLVQSGILGLMDAVEKYDPNRNVQLKQYAEFRIRGAILDSLRHDDWSPRTLRRSARKLEQATADCKADLGREPSEQELAAALCIQLQGLQRIKMDLSRLQIESLEGYSKKNDVDETTLASDVEQSPYERTLLSELLSLMEKELRELPKRDRTVLELYYYKERTMKEVAAMLGVGESRVSQIHSAVLSRLRSRLGASSQAVATRLD